MNLEANDVIGGLLEEISRLSQENALMRVQLNLIASKDQGEEVKDDDDTVQAGKLGQ